MHTTKHDRATTSNKDAPESPYDHAWHDHRILVTPLVEEIMRLIASNSFSLWLPQLGPWFRHQECSDLQNHCARHLVEQIRLSMEALEAEKQGSAEDFYWRLSSSFALLSSPMFGNTLGGKTMRIPHLTNKIEMATDSSLVWTLHLRWSRTLLGAAMLIRKSSLSSFFIFLAPFLLQTSYMQHPVTLSPKLCTTLTGIGMICFCRIGGAWMNNMVHQTLEWWSNWIWYSTGFFKNGEITVKPS